MNTKFCKVFELDNGSQVLYQYDTDENDKTILKITTKIEGFYIGATLSNSDKGIHKIDLSEIDKNQAQIFFNELRDQFFTN